MPVRGSDEIASLGKTFNHMAESLERAETSRRAMTADIAHELRNPLAVQRANLEAMQDGIYPLTVENLEQVLEQNRLLTRLVEDLRTLALVDAGQLTLERTPTDFPALVQRMVDRLTPTASAHQVKLSLELPAAPIAPISLDPLRVEQILGNLLSNALHHTPEGGQISLKLAPVARGNKPVRAGYRRGHSRRCAAAPVRAFLPRRQSAQPGGRRQRAGIDDRPPVSRGPRGYADSCQPSGGRGGIYINAG